MKVYLATDHAGFDLKEKIKAFLQQKNYDVEDCGAHELNNNDDYPDFIGKAAQAVSKDPLNARGIVIGGSGEAEAMVANKYPGVRCGLFYAPVEPVTAADVTGRESHDPFEIIHLTRQHNNSNMLSLSARFLREEDALKAVILWLETPFPGDERHVRRIEKINQIEEELYR
jgi:ribose 5-phosphate isomerase B